MSSLSLVQLLNQKIDFKLNSSIFLKISLLLFIVISFALNETGLMPVSFIGLLVIFLLQKNTNEIINKIVGNFPTEMMILNAWVLFTFLTGIFTAKNYSVFTSSLTSLVFLTAVVNLICCILLYDIRLVKIILLGMLIAGLIQIGAIYLGIGNVVNERSGRQLGLNNNPNSLGLKMVYATFSVMIFLGLIKRIKLHFLILIIFCLFLFLNGILMSGSRKSTLSFFIVVCLSLILTISNRFKKVNIFLIGFLLFIAALGLKSLAPILLEGTIVGERFETLEQEGGVENDARFEMYKIGLDIFYDNPLIGIGLGNYREYNYWGLYSHSDYIESLTSTGGIGFILYQSVFLIVFFRSFWLFNVLKNPLIRFYSIMSFICILTLKIIGLGVILYYSPSAMILIATFSALTIQIKKYYYAEKRTPYPHLL